MALNYAQTINNSGIPNALKLRILNAVVYRHGYTDTIKDSNGNDIPNPITKAQFYNFVLDRWHREQLKNYEAEPAGEAVKLVKIQEIDSLVID